MKTRSFKIRTRVHISNLGNQPIAPLIHSLSNYDIVINQRALDRIDVSIATFYNITKKELLIDGNLVIIESGFENDEEFYTFIDEVLISIFKLKLVEDFTYYTTKGTLYAKEIPEWTTLYFGKLEGVFNSANEPTHIICYKKTKDLKQLESQITHIDGDILKTSEYDIVINLSTLKALNVDIKTFAKVTKKSFFTNGKVLVIQYRHNFDKFIQMQEFITETLESIFNLTKNKDFIYYQCCTCCSCAGSLNADWVDLVYVHEVFNSDYEYYIETL